MNISVVIPFYNLAQYVHETLDSVVAAANLHPVPIEVICVDDGSTDGTGAILDGYASTFDLRPSSLSFRVIHQPNGGEGCARNKGIAEATGDWVTFLDGDDRWLPNHLEEAVPLLERHADADVVNLRFAPFADGDTAPAMTSGQSVASFDISREIGDRVLMEVGVYPTFFRREVFRSVMFSDLPLGADRLFVARCLAQAKKVVLSDAVVHAYRVRESSMARAAWSARKVQSQCDYSAGALAALADSGKRIGSKGAAYLASLWLSDVPAHLQRLRSVGERRAAMRHWRRSWSSSAVRLLPMRHRIALALLRVFSFSSAMTLSAARVLRHLGIT